MEGGVGRSVDSSHTPFVERLFLYSTRLTIINNGIRITVEVARGDRVAGMLWDCACTARCGVAQRSGGLATEVKIGCGGWILTLKGHGRNPTLKGPDSGGGADVFMRRA